MCGCTERHPVRFDFHIVRGSNDCHDTVKQGLMLD
jgi:hypothetical protein